MVGVNSPDNYSRFGFGMAQNGQYKITAKEGYHRTDLSTIEGIQSMLGVHEYYGHGVRNYSGGINHGGTHWKAYDEQIKHRTFRLLPPKLQRNITDQKKNHIRIENPNLYFKLYE